MAIHYHRAPSQDRQELKHTGFNIMPSLFPFSEKKKNLDEKIALEICQMWLSFILGN